MNVEVIKGEQYFDTPLPPALPMERWRDSDRAESGGTGAGAIL